MNTLQSRLLRIKTDFLMWYYWALRYRGMHALIFGYPAYRDMKGNLKWKWLDDHSDIDLKNINRNCLKCMLKITEAGHDPCIPNLEGVKHACCGHGMVPGEVMYPCGQLHLY